MQKNNIHVKMKFFTGHTVTKHGFSLFRSENCLADIKINQV